jgi:hypothetical protein
VLSSQTAQFDEVIINLLLKPLSLCGVIEHSEKLLYYLRRLYSKNPKLVKYVNVSCVLRLKLVVAFSGAYRLDKKLASSTSWKPPLWLLYYVFYVNV